MTEHARPDAIDPADTAFTACPACGGTAQDWSRLTRHTSDLTAGFLHRTCGAVLLLAPRGLYALHHLPQDGRYELVPLPAVPAHPAA